MNSLTKYQLRSHRVGLLHEDDDVIVLDKPAGLLSLPDRFDRTAPSILSLFATGGEDVLMVHRLDKDTSGCFVLARNRECHSFLNAEFRSRRVGKSYWAVCIGDVADEKGLIDLPVGEHRATHTMRIDRKKGKPSQTVFTVIERFRAHTLVELQPRTGRTHQIRVHLQALGHPILADSVYGGGAPFFLSRIKKNYRRGADAERPLLSRTALHASSVEFLHPRTREVLTFQAPLPKDMRSVVRMLRKYAPPGHH